MKNKGFTLIELLAVIVILAIIALIAVPIILNIIEDAKKESDERSVELYASAIKNGIASHQLRTGNEVTPGTYNETNPLPFTVEYEGNVECETTEIYEDGNIYIEGCIVNGGEEIYNYGTKQEETTEEETGSPQPSRYYSWSSGSVGGNLSSDATPNASELGKTHYLGLDVIDGKVTAVYACFTRNETEYCLSYGETAYETNKTVIEEAFKDVDSGCYFGEDYYDCIAGGVRAYAHSKGGVFTEDDGNALCRVNDDYSFECFYLY